MLLPIRTSGFDASKLYQYLDRTAGLISHPSFFLVLAGAEDVLGDLGVRQALKKMPRDARL
jgi:hypothetical protein